MQRHRRSWSFPVRVAYSRSMGLSSRQLKFDITLRPIVVVVNNDDRERLTRHNAHVSVWFTAVGLNVRVQENTIS